MERNMEWNGTWNVRTTLFGGPGDLRLRKSVWKSVRNKDNKLKLNEKHCSGQSRFSLFYAEMHWGWMLFYPMCDEIKHEPPHGCFLWLINATILCRLYSNRAGIRCILFHANITRHCNSALYFKLSVGWVWWHCCQSFQSRYFRQHSCCWLSRWENLLGRAPWFFK